MKKSLKDLVTPDSGESSNFGAFTDVDGGEAKINLDELRKHEIFFATPCYGGMLTDQYFLSMFRASQTLMRHGINFRVTTLRNESLVTRARNILTAMFMESETYGFSENRKYNADYDDFRIKGVQKIIRTYKQQAKKQLMELEFQYNMQLKDMEVSGQKQKEKDKEDRKDERTRIQASQQSELIEQRQTGKPPKKFESAGNDILSGNFDLGMYEPK